MIAHTLYIIIGYHILHHLISDEVFTVFVTSPAKKTMRHEHAYDPRIVPFLTPTLLKI